MEGIRRKGGPGPERTGGDEPSGPRIGLETIRYEGGREGAGREALSVKKERKGRALRSRGG